jgi:hypothetical protein
MKRTVLVCLIFSAAVASGAAQKKIKPWTEWSAKDAQKILDDSPWGQTQTETSLEEMFFNPTAVQRQSESRQTQGATNQATPVNFRIRFLSAKPIRQALMRVIEAQQKTPNRELSEQMRDFVERNFDQWIVIAVHWDSPDQRFSGPVMQAFKSANLGVLKNNTFLEIKGGKRLFLEDYKPPINDGLGAKFIFPRVVEGQPFITPDTGSVRFYSEVFDAFRLNMRFKVADMMYEGKLEH